VSAIERRRPPWLTVLCAALSAGLCVAAMLRFYRRFVFDEPSGRVWGLADDVYISACFGRSLVTGHGFVWYPGAPRVEGITNPMWSVVLGVLHLLPGFSADRLGLFVVVTNALLLMAAAWCFWAALGRAGVGRLAPPALVLLFVPACLGLSYWSAEGFEVALVAALAFGMLHVALGEGGALPLGLLLAAGVVTRMDFVIMAAPALITFAARRGLARAARAALIGGALIAALLLARRAYFGAWLPNTYWLKATGWALRARLARGVNQNATLLALLPAPWLTLLVPALRRQLPPHALAAWLLCRRRLVAAVRWLRSAYSRRRFVAGVGLGSGAVGAGRSAVGASAGVARGERVRDRAARARRLAAGRERPLQPARPAALAGARVDRVWQDVRRDLAARRAHRDLSRWRDRVLLGPRRRRPARQGRSVGGALAGVDLAPQGRRVLARRTGTQQGR
jgi:hypothetical protein